MAFHFQQSGDLAPFLSPPFFWGSYYCEESLLLGLGQRTAYIHVFGVRHAVDTWVSRAFDTQPASPYGLTAALNTMFLTPAGLRAPVVAQCHRFRTKIVSAESVACEAHTGQLSLTNSTSVTTGPQYIFNRGVRGPRQALSSHIAQNH